MPNTDNLEKTKIQEWIVAYLIDLGLSPEEIDPTVEFTAHGLDSSGTIGLVGDLGDWLGLNLPSSIVNDYPTIERLTEHLVTNTSMEY